MCTDATCGQNQCHYIKELDMSQTLEAHITAAMPHVNLGSVPWQQLYAVFLDIYASLTKNFPGLLPFAKPASVADFRALKLPPWLLAVLQQIIAGLLSGGLGGLAGGAAATP